MTKPEETFTITSFQNWKNAPVKNSELTKHQSSLHKKPSEDSMKIVDYVTKKECR